MKRYSFIALCAILTLFCVVSLAMGTEIYRSDENYTDFPRYVAYLNGECYLFFHSDDIESVSDSGVRTQYKWAEDAFKAKDDERLSYSCVVSDGNKLLALVVVTEYDDKDEMNNVKGAYLRELVFDGNEVRLGDEVELDWDDMVEPYDDGEYSREVERPFIQDGYFVFNTYGYDSNEIMAYDIASGEGKTLELENIESVAPFKDGRVLGVMYEYKDTSIDIAFAAIDLSTGDVSPLSKPTAIVDSIPSCPYYDEDDDAVYYLAGGELRKASAFDLDKAQKICAAKDEGAQSQPIKTDDGGLIITSYRTVTKYNTDPSAHPDKTLTVAAWGEGIDNAWYAFGQDHPDTDVVITDSGVMDVLNAMTSQSSDVDIYMLQVSSPSYQSLFNRGYMADMSSSDKLTTLVDEMYGMIKASVTKDGKLCALPTELRNNVYSLSSEALKKAGLSDIEVPTTWTGFFEMLNSLAETIEDNASMSAFSPSYTVSRLRAELIRKILSDYMLYLVESGGELSFDSQILREIFEAFDEVDFEALGIPVEEESGFLSWSYDDVLLNEYGGIYADRWNDMNSTPIILALDENTPPIIALELYALVINPYSKNIELAIEFMEEVSDHLDSAFLIHTCPANNEPILNPYIDTVVESHDKQIASLKASLEKADEDAKELIAEEIKQEEQFFEEYMKEEKYRASEESIARYRSYDDMMRVNTNTIGFDLTGATELNALISQYADRAIDREALITGFDQKLRMMILEGA